MVCHMFKIIWSVSSRWFGACKWIIILRKRLVVGWSHSDFLTTAAHIGYLADSSFRMILKRTECFWLPNLFVFFEINTRPFPPKNFTILSQKMKRLEQCKVTWVDCKYWAGFCSEFTKITVFFLQNYRAKIHSWTGQMVCLMLKII